MVLLVNFIKFNSLRAGQRTFRHFQQIIRLSQKTPTSLEMVILANLMAQVTCNQKKNTNFSITLFPWGLHLSNNRERSIKGYFCAEMAVSGGVTSCDKVLVSISLRGRNYIIYGSRSNFARFKLEKGHQFANYCSVFFSHMLNCPESSRLECCDSANLLNAC